MLQHFFRFRCFQCNETKDIPLTRGINDYGNTIMRFECEKCRYSNQISCRGKQPLARFITKDVFTVQKEEKMSGYSDPCKMCGSKEIIPDNVEVVTYNCIRCGYKVHFDRRKWVNRSAFLMSREERDYHLNGNWDFQSSWEKMRSMEHTLSMAERRRDEEINAAIIRKRDEDQKEKLHLAMMNKMGAPTTPSHKTDCLRYVMESMQSGKNKRLIEEYSKMIGLPSILQPLKITLEEVNKMPENPVLENYSFGVTCEEAVDLFKVAEDLSETNYCLHVITDNTDTPKNNAILVHKSIINRAHICNINLPELIKFEGFKEFGVFYPDANNYHLVSPELAKVSYKDYKRVMNWIAMVRKARYADHFNTKINGKKIMIKVTNCSRIEGK